jgi:peptide/nickel transport system substrate-binding protein
VQFNVERMLAGEHRLSGTGPLALPFSETGLTGARVLDDYTVQLSLSAPFPPLLAHLATPAGLIVSPTAAQRYGRDFRRNPVGTGAFQFVDWDGEAQITLTAYRDFQEAGGGAAGGGAGTEYITFRPFPDEQARVSAMLSGEVDLIVDAPGQQLQVFRQRGAFRVHEEAGAHMEFLVLDMRDRPFSEHAMRQAVNYAINKTALIDRVFDGAADVANGPIPPVFAWAHNGDIEPYPYDPGRARELIFRSGYRGEEIVVSVPDGRWRRQLTEDLTAAGLNVTVYLEPDNARLEGVADIAHVSWPAIDPETLPFLTLRADAFPETGGYNRGYYPNRDVNALLNQAWDAPHLADRADMYRQVQAIVREDAPWVFVANRRHNMVTVDRLSGVELHPAGVPNLHGAVLE